GVAIQGATALALTKMDILGYMEKIPVCTHYTVNGVVTDSFPFPSALDDAKPVIEYVDGWGCDVSSARRFEDLPKAARDYVEMIEDAVGCRIKYVSVGAERDRIIIR
ncbi:MAG: adenylosuccinate synthetase, partial [Oscillospiraceae bacterium]|nr:adenylosuccinate synthetase [Oscillospiraceae bacterium]